MPEIIALAGRLDLDHVRSKVGQHHGGVGTGNEMAEVDNPDASERGGRGRVTGGGGRQLSFDLVQQEHG
jgi:hypothetical protein